MSDGNIKRMEFNKNKTEVRRWILHFSKLFRACIRGGYVCMYNFCQAGGGRLLVDMRITCRHFIISETAKVRQLVRGGGLKLNDKKSEWSKSRNSKLSKFKCRKATIINDFKVLNKNWRTQRCRKKFKLKANIRMLEITKGEITN